MQKTGEQLDWSSPIRWTRKGWVAVGQSYGVLGTHVRVAKRIERTGEREQAASGLLAEARTARSVGGNEGADKSSTGPGKRKRVPRMNGASSTTTLRTRNWQGMLYPLGEDAGRAGSD